MKRQDDFNQQVNALTQHASGSVTFGVPVNGDTLIVDGNTFTKVAAAPGAGEFVTISELEALIEAVAGVNSSQDGTTITVLAAAPGTAGNAITLALGGGNTGTLAISGATLTGGVDQTYSDTYEIDQDKRSVDLKFNVTALGGTSPTVDVTVQFSDDKSNWVDEDSFNQIVGTGLVRMSVAARYRFMRLKVVLGGTNPSLTASLHAMASDEDQVVDQPVVKNVTCTLADTEYSQAIPASTKKFLLKARAAADLKFSFVSGGSASLYVTIPAGSGGLWIDAAKMRGLTIYFQSPTAGTVAEMLCVK
jgi:hypothetical protein